MESLHQKQARFTRMIALLILYAVQQGFEVTFCPEHVKHKENSLHYCGLAKDLNLFRDGKYLTTTEAHLPLGEFWERIGGTWGGRFTSPCPDGNHYSLEHNGVK